MNDSNQGQYALLLIFISILLVLGSLLTAFAETGISGEGASPQVTDFVFSTPTLNATSTPTEYLTAPSPTGPPATQEARQTDTASPPQCKPPAGWAVHLIQSGETAETVAEQFKITVEDLIEGNCLQTELLPPGTIIFVPTSSSAPEAADSAACPSPTGWASYTVKQGDNLFKISQAFSISIKELQTANCMGSSTTIISGTKISVPNAAAITPTKP